MKFLYHITKMVTLEHDFIKYLSQWVLKVDLASQFTVTLTKNWHDYGQSAIETSVNKIYLYHKKWCYWKHRIFDGFVKKKQEYLMR